MALESFAVWIFNFCFQDKDMGVVKRIKTNGEGYDQPNDGSQVRFVSSWTLFVCRCVLISVRCISQIWYFSRLKFQSLVKSTEKFSTIGLWSLRLVRASTCSFQGGSFSCFTPVYACTSVLTPASFVLASSSTHATFPLTSSALISIPPDSFILKLLVQTILLPCSYQRSGVRPGEDEEEGRGSGEVEVTLTPIYKPTTHIHN